MFAVYLLLIEVIESSFASLRYDELSRIEMHF